MGKGKIDIVSPVSSFQHKNAVTQIIFIWMSKHEAGNGIYMQAKKSFRASSSKTGIASFFLDSHSNDSRYSLLSSALRFNYRKIYPIYITCDESTLSYQLTYV